MLSVFMAKFTDFSLRNRRHGQLRMNVEKIYLDMDGVLADFERGVREICGVVPMDQNAKHRGPGDDDEMWEKI